MIVTLPLAMVKWTMKAQGIPEVPEGFLHDHSLKEPMNRLVVVVVSKMMHYLLLVSFGHFPCCASQGQRTKDEQIL
jgi:hypothetical protein